LHIQVYSSNPPGQAPTLKIVMVLLPYTQQRIIGISELSLESGALHDAQNGRNQTLLDMGPVSRNREVARYLAHHIVAMDLWDLNGRDSTGRSPHDLGHDARLPSVGIAKHQISLVVSGRLGCMMRIQRAMLRLCGHYLTRVRGTAFTHVHNTYL